MNIYIDSKCAFLILHAHAAVWKEQLLLALLINMPKTFFISWRQFSSYLVVIHVPGYQKGENTIAKGNKAADVAVQAAVL